MTYPSTPESILLAGPRAPGRPESACTSDKLRAHWLRADYCVHYRRATDSTPPIRASVDAAAFFRDAAPLDSSWGELFLLLALDAKNRPLGVFELARGGRTSATIDRSVVLQAALLAGSVGAILCHNHPSGDPTPSPEDIAFTQYLKQGFDAVSIRLLDHIVVAHGQLRFSFLDAGLMPQ